MEKLEISLVLGKAGKKYPRYNFQIPTTYLKQGQLTAGNRYKLTIEPAAENAK